MEKFVCPCGCEHFAPLSTAVLGPPVGVPVDLAAPRQVVCGACHARWELTPGEQPKRLQLGQA